MLLKEVGPREEQDPCPVLCTVFTEMVIFLNCKSQKNFKSMDLNNVVFFNKTQTVGIIVKNKLDLMKVKTIKIGAGEVVQQL